MLNYAWRDYGNRVGAWRLLELFDELELPCSRAGQQRDLRLRARADRRRSGPRGDEIVGHGRTNSERQGALTEDEERALIAEATARSPRHEGAPPARLARPLDLARAT